MEKKTSSKIGNGRKRGVGSIIGGVLLIGILMTSVLVYFVTVLNNEKAKTGYELQSEQQNLDKTAESYTVQRAGTVTGGNIGIEIKNTGSLPMVASRSLVYCIEGAAPGCETPSVPIENGEIGTSLVVLNPGDSYEENVGGARLTNNNSYRVDVISERGNIVSSTVCVLEGGICADDGDGGGPPDVTGDITEGIIQGTGSFQLDFKSFGAIYPSLQDRDGIQQSGWKVQASQVAGYPGFTLKQSLPTIIVERLRNLDPSTENMVLDKGTVLVVNPGGTPGTGPASNYLCTRSGESVIAYDGAQVIPYTAPNAAFDVGMQTLYFCSTTQGGGAANWSPDDKFGYVNPIFMITRADFENSKIDYGQTIPYQSFTMSPPLTAWNVCLKADDTDIRTANNCRDPTQADPTPAQPYRYQGNPGSSVFAHFNQGGFGTGPYHLEWIYRDGSHETVAYTTTARGNLQFTVPTTMADGTTGIVRNEYYILKISDSFVSDGGPHVNFMTFRVT